MLLSGKICVVTGAASERGLGLATAKLFASHGAKVAILDLDAEASKRGGRVDRAGRISASPAT